MDNPTHQRILDTDTSYFMQGEGEPVVMLHGMAATSDIWVHAYNDLSQRYRVIAPDLPGHGRSPGQARRYSLQFYTRWLDALLMELGVDEPMTLFGNSMGGAVSLQYALEYPDRVARIVLVNSLGVGPDLPGGIGHVIKHLPDFIGLMTTGKLNPYLYRYLKGVVIYNPDDVSRDIIETMADLNLKQGPMGIWSAWAGISLIIEDFLTPGKRRAFQQRIATLSQPVLIAWGEHDGLLPVKNAYAAKQTISQSALKLFNRSAHSPMLEEPDAFNETVRAFMIDTE